VNTNYYSEKERKANRVWTSSNSHFYFYHSVDLSDGVRIRPLISDYTENELCQATAEFICIWTINEYPKLNGFPGIDTVKFEVKNL
jgi:hypothetical protein